MKNNFIILFLFLSNLCLINISNSAENKIYEKIDLFGEVLEKINN